MIYNKGSLNKILYRYGLKEVRMRILHIFITRTVSSAYISICIKGFWEALLVVAIIIILHHIIQKIKEKLHDKNKRLNLLNINAAIGACWVIHHKFQY